MTRRRSRRFAALLILVLGLTALGYAVWLTRSGNPGDGSLSSPAGSSAGSAEPVPTRRCEPAVADGIPVQPGTAVPLPDAAASLGAAQALRGADRSCGDTFCRDRFGPSTWPDLDRNGCSTRQDVLVRQAQTVTTRRIASKGNTCEEAISGTWIDPYTGETLTFTNLKDSAQAQRLQIDHVVSLYNAWVSGASEWTDERRVIFANDLAAPELRAVAGSVNFAKDHAGAEAWQPGAAYQCDFARAYVEVKRRYDLAVTTRERTALISMLGTCPT